MNFTEKELENKAKELIDEIVEFYKENNWLVVKKYILRYSHPEVRKKFSTRHFKTKKHTLNNFEKNLINYCKDNYGINLELFKEDTHYEKNIKD